MTGLNARARERLGMGEECIGHDIVELFPLSWATYARSILEHAVEEGVPAQFNFYGRELASWFDIRVHPTPAGVDVAFRDLIDHSLKPGRKAAPSLAALADTRAGMTAVGAADARPAGAFHFSAVPGVDRHWSDWELAVVAEGIYHDRRRRKELLPIESAEPHWDILLDLFVHSARNNRVSVTSACIAADVPQSTALRALDQLSEVGFINRRPDVRDRRRIWVEPTHHAIEAMRDYLSHSAVATGVRS